MPNRNMDEYLHKAAKYDTLSNYFKYSNPNLHIQYYYKHLENIAKALEQDRDHIMHSSNEPGNLRLLHAAPNAGNVDIYVNGTKIFSNYPYQRLSEYLSLPAGKYQVDVYPAGNQTNTVLSQRIMVEPRQSVTLAVTVKDKKFKLVSIPDTIQVPMGEAALRIVHLSPDAPEVDIGIKDGAAIFKELAYRKNTNYLAITPTTADLEVRAAGTNQVVLPLNKLEFKPGTPYTIYIIGLASGGTPNLQAVITSP